MFRTILSRPVTTTAAIALFALTLASSSAFACKNPFNSAQADDSNLPLIASNETGKCGGDMSTEGKCGGNMSTDGMPAGEAKKCEGSMSTDGKPTSEEKKCDGSMSKDGKPSGEVMQCGAGKCGGK